MYCARAPAAIASSPFVAERSSDLALSHNGSPDEEESAVCSGGVAAVSGVAVLNLSRIMLALGGLVGWLVFILRLVDGDEIHHLASRRAYTTC